MNGLKLLDINMQENKKCVGRRKDVRTKDVLMQENNIQLETKKVIDV